MPYFILILLDFHLIHRMYHLLLYCIFKNSMEKKKKNTFEPQSNSRIRAFLAQGGARTEAMLRRTAGAIQGVSILHYTAGELHCSVFACSQLFPQRPFAKLSGCPQRFLPLHLNEICGALAAFRVECLNCSYRLFILEY